MRYANGEEQREIVSKRTNEREKEREESGGGLGWRRGARTGGGGRLRNVRER